MDVMSMCSSPPNQTAPRKIPEFASLVSHAQQSLPSPPLMDMVNEKKGSPLPPITSILHSPVPPLHEINPNPLPPSIIAPKSNHDSSSDTVANHNLYHQSSSTPQSPPLRINYLQPPESISQSMAHRSSPSSSTSSSSYLLSPSMSHSPNDTTPSLSTTTSYPSYYRQSYQPQPPHPTQQSQYPYNPQSQQQRHNNYSHPSVNTSMTSEYPPPYATSLNYTSSGNNLNGEDSDTPYIQQTTEQSLAKMGKVVDHCNQIAHFASQYRDMRMNYNSWNGSLVPQVNDSHLTGIVNRAYDVLNILSSLKSELTRPPSAETNQDEIDLIRKQRTLGASTRTKYRKRSKRAAPPGRCHSCNISETPEWRRGPDGARTLCNACGLHFAKITRKRALSVMQQAEQQQQQQPTASRSPNLTIPDNNNNNNSSMLTPGASDVERDSPNK
ncbi:unnamed protein product [Rhizophagus irregularis]|uniref:GATA-type domain-containing protein n=1 Tax=Rhizophagus irregularis TaxID=588596 RepID=A0A2N1NJG3_9GLOM|nr:hypothetical protein RhiirC2_739526 [Rhizophagus irregularis]CAB4382701.1 unnamed protein product [Rhizophagus irregularis]CAB5371829.1 unnamed protein product [Rhizophagus irregularis]